MIPLILCAGLCGAEEETGACVLCNRRPSPTDQGARRAGAASRYRHGWRLHLCRYDVSVRHRQLREWPAARALSLQS